MNKKVAIILINWNSFNYTSDCINSIRQIQYPDYDIIVVDNGSTDQSIEKFNHHFKDSIILIQSDKNTGFTGGNNIGMQYTIDHQYEYCLLLNNDTFVDKNFLGPMIEYMKQNTHTGALQPRIHFNHDRSLLWNGGSCFNKLLGLTYVKNYGRSFELRMNKIKKVDWITGCAFLVRTTVLQQCGLLAENMFIYYEDVDLSFRIKKAGYDLVYFPQSVIYHISGMANKNKIKGKEGYVNPIVHYLNIRNTIWFLKQYTSAGYSPTVILFNFFYLTALIGYFAVRLRFTKLKIVLKAIKDGLKGHIIYQQ